MVAISQYLDLAKDECLSILVHAGAKVGKTTFSQTAPYPLLIMDVDGLGTKFLRNRKVTWDPFQGPPPAHDGTWDVCVIKVTRWETVTQTLQWLQSDAHPFVSFSIDSITEMQRRCRENLKGTAAMQTQDWGMLLSKMETVIRDFRDLCVDHPKIRVGVFVAESRQNDKSLRMAPYMQGSISKSAPYWFDIVGFLTFDMQADANGQLTQRVRKLCIGYDPAYESGERVQGAVPDIMYNPNITHMLRAMYGKTEEETQSV